MTLSAALAAAVILTSAGPDLIRPHQDQETRLPDVAVTGGTVEERALDFVGRVAGPPRGRGVARWNMPVCAAAVNLDNAPAQVILDRIGDVARSLDLRVGAPGCEPNLVVIFTSDGSALARSMVTQNRRIFDPGVGGISRGSRELEAFQTGDAPVRWWSLSVAFDSATGQRAARVPGDIPSRTDVPVQFARDFLCNVDDCSIRYAPARAVTTSSRLRTRVEDALYKSIIVVDVERTGAIDAASLGDYLAFISLAQIAGDADAAPYDSILNLFSNGGRNGITAWDRAYLEAVYGTHAGLRSTEGRMREVAALMARNASAAADVE